MQSHNIGLVDWWTNPFKPHWIENILMNPCHWQLRLRNKITTQIRSTTAACLERKWRLSAFGTLVTHEVFLGGSVFTGHGARCSKVTTTEVGAKIFSFIRWGWRATPILVASQFLLIHLYQRLLVKHPLYKLRLFQHKTSNLLLLVTSEECPESHEEATRWLRFFESWDSRGWLCRANFWFMTLVTTCRTCGLLECLRLEAVQFQKLQSLSVNLL